MKNYEDSIISYKCTGCGVTIYNATKELKKCDECGYKLRKINKSLRGCEHCGNPDCHWLLHG